MARKITLCDECDETNWISKIVCVVCHFDGPFHHVFTAPVDAHKVRKSIGQRRKILTAKYKKCEVEISVTLL
jgi:hypothetical protein